MKQKIDIRDLQSTPFYIIEKAIKSYRQFAQRNIYEKGLDITIDQWLILQTIHNNPTLNQKQIADIVFKDYASITRMISILVKKGFISKGNVPEDKRNNKIKLTVSGLEIYQKLIPVIKQNRDEALKKISEKDQEELTRILKIMIQNVS